MKKEQMTYIGIGLLIVFVFMLVTMNTSSVSSSGYNGYTFNNDLGKSAGRMNSGVRMVNYPRQSQEGFLSGTPL